MWRACEFSFRTTTNWPTPRLGSPAHSLPSRERAVQTDLDTAILAPARSTKALAPANTIERYVGRQVANAAMILLEALAEHSDGGLTPATRTRGGDQLAEL